MSIPTLPIVRERALRDLVDELEHAATVVATLNAITNVHDHIHPDHFDRLVETIFAAMDVVDELRLSR